MFNTIVATRKIATELKECLLLPTLKIGVWKVPDNYIGITLMNKIFKLVKAISKDKIEDIVDMTEK